jgi:hypothetical protein
LRVGVGFIPFEMRTPSMGVGGLRGIPEPYASAPLWDQYHWRRLRATATRHASHRHP